MPYLEYPAYEYLQAIRRDSEEVMCGQAIPVQQDRLLARTSSGWASEQRRVYRPLGTPETLPTQGSELRRSRSLKAKKPRIVLPGEQGGDKENASQTNVTELVVGKKVRGQVDQFQYRYFSITVLERLELAIHVTALQGDPVLFVSNEGSYPTREDHTWKADVSGFTELLISTEHPEFALGHYCVGVYGGVYDSQFEIEVSLSEPPLNVSLLSEASILQDDGYSLLSELVAGAERRRYTAKHSSTPRSSRPPRDPHQLYLTIPSQLHQTVTSAAEKTVKAQEEAEKVRTPRKSYGRAAAAAAMEDVIPVQKRAAEPNGGASGPFKRPASGKQAASSKAAPQKDAQEDTPADGSQETACTAVSFLCTPYLRAAIFGDSMTPSHTSASPEPRDYEASARPPWLPTEADISRQAEVAMAAARAPSHMRPKMLRLSHVAMKYDMDKQMRRVAEGLHTERSLVALFKASALSETLDEDSAQIIDGGGSIPAMKRMRSSANQHCDMCLEALHEVARNELLKVHTDEKLAPAVHIAASQRTLSRAPTKTFQGVHSLDVMLTSALTSNEGAVTGTPRFRRRSSITRMNKFTTEDDMVIRGVECIRQVTFDKRELPAEVKEPLEFPSVPSTASGSSMPRKSPRIPYKPPRNPFGTTRPSNHSLRASPRRVTTLPPVPRAASASASPRTQFVVSQSAATSQLLDMPVHLSPLHSGLALAIDLDAHPSDSLSTRKLDDPEPANTARGGRDKSNACRFRLTTEIDAEGQHPAVPSMNVAR